MIIDFNYPNLTADGWRVNVVKTLRDGRSWMQQMRFDSKEDAFAFYTTVHRAWQLQESNKRIREYAKQKEQYIR